MIFAPSDGCIVPLKLFRFVALQPGLRATTCRSRCVIAKVQVMALRADFEELYTYVYINRKKRDDQEEDIKVVNKTTS